MAMTLRRLGNTQIEVTSIGLGTWQFAGKKSVVGAGYWSTPAQQEINAIVKAALDGGSNWFDTAELYGSGQSERRLAHALIEAEQSKGDVVIATKWRPIGRTARSIGRTIDERLQSVAPFGIDLYQIHFPVLTFSSIEAQMDAMADLVDAGKVRAVGVSNFDAEQMQRAYDHLSSRGIPLASNQVEYNLLNRRIESNGVLDRARALGVTIIAYSPLEMGLLTGKFHKNPALLDRAPLLRRKRLRKQLRASSPVIETLARIAERHGATPAQIALCWLINAHGDLVVAIPGATKVRHAAENAKAMTIACTEDEMAAIEKITKPFR